MSDARVELRDVPQTDNGGRILGSGDISSSGPIISAPGTPGSGKEISGSVQEDHGPLPGPGYEISDPEFISRLNQLVALRSFLTRQAIPLTGLASTSHLNLLRLGKRGGGRFPTAGEWQLLEQNTEALFGLLSEPLRRKFLSSQIPTWVTRTAMFLGGAAIVAFFMGLIVPKWDPNLLLLHFLVWVAALGAIGSIAFIGMNALAVQDDATFDLTNEKLIVLRIALGALFAVVLTLPFGYIHFKQFLTEIGGNRTPIEETGELFERAVMLLLPFILGFSTTLVIMILNRFVEAVQSFFGKSGAPPAAGATSPVVTAPVSNVTPAAPNKEQPAPKVLK